MRKHKILASLCNWADLFILTWSQTIANAFQNTRKW